MVNDRHPGVSLYPMSDIDISMSAKLLKWYNLNDKPWAKLVDAWIGSVHNPSKANLRFAAFSDFVVRSKGKK